MSRSETRATIWLARSARTTETPADLLRAITLKPCDRRSSANQLNSSGGRSASTTTVKGNPWRTNHEPPTSHPPTWGRARMAPVPASSAAWMCSSPSMVKPASTSSGVMWGSRSDSIQYRA
jgi:hypothetical protein